MAQSMSWSNAMDASPPLARDRFDSEGANMSRRFIIGLVILAWLPIPASAQYIGIFMDANATSCAAQVGSTPWIELHVIAILQGNVPFLSGAQFQITGAPESWTADNVLWVPDAGVTINMGHPLFTNPIHPSTPGVNVAFSACQGNERVPLGRVILLGARTPEDVHLRVVGYQLLPSEPRCPIVFDCTFPTYPMVCVGGGEIVLNGSAPAGCEVAVEARTWSSVKTLYR
jgi:hypothetical protein